MVAIEGENLDARGADGAKDKQNYHRQLLNETKIILQQFEDFVNNSCVTTATKNIVELREIVESQKQAIDAHKNALDKLKPPHRLDDNKVDAAENNLENVLHDVRVKFALKQLGSLTSLIAGNTESDGKIDPITMKSRLQAGIHYYRKLIGAFRCKNDEAMKNVLIVAKSMNEIIGFFGNVIGIYRKMLKCGTEVEVGYLSLLMGVLRRSILYLKVAAEMETIGRIIDVDFKLKSNDIGGFIKLETERLNSLYED